MTTTSIGFPYWYASTSNRYVLISFWVVQFCNLYMMILKSGSNSTPYELTPNMKLSLPLWMLVNRNWTAGELEE